MKLIGKMKFKKFKSGIIFSNGSIVLYNDNIINFKKFIFLKKKVKKFEINFKELNHSFFNKNKYTGYFLKNY